MAEEVDLDAVYFEAGIGSHFFEDVCATLEAEYTEDGNVDALRALGVVKERLYALRDLLHDQIQRAESVRREEAAAAAAAQREALAPALQQGLLPADLQQGTGQSALLPPAGDGG